MADKTFYERFISVQSELKAPKSQFNKFGNYSYRNCEDILEALKPLLAKNSLFIRINDEVEMVGDRFYVKATAIISDGDKGISSSAYAREDLQRKGMDASQLTGATSSYARKYALNALLAIDDTKDSDATNTHGKESAQRKTQQNQVNQKAVDYFSSKASLVSDIKELDDLKLKVIKPLVERNDKLTIDAVNSSYLNFKASLEA